MPHHHLRGRNGAQPLDVAAYPKAPWRCSHRPRIVIERFDELACAGWVPLFPTLHGSASFRRWRNRAVLGRGFGPLGELAPAASNGRCGRASTTAHRIRGCAQDRGLLPTAHAALGRAVTPHSQPRPWPAPRRSGGANGAEAACRRQQTAAWTAAPTWPASIPSGALLRGRAHAERKHPAKAPSSPRDHLRPPTAAAAQAAR